MVPWKIKAVQSALFTTFYFFFSPWQSGAVAMDLE